MNWTRDNQGELRKFALKAPTFDLNTVRALATSLPLDTALLRQLRVLQPAGHIDNLDVAWSRERAGMLSRTPGPSALRRAGHAAQGLGERPAGHAGHGRRWPAAPARRVSLSFRAISVSMTARAPRGWTAPMHRADVPGRVRGAAHPVRRTARRESAGRRRRASSPCTRMACALPTPTTGRHRARQMAGRRRRPWRHRRYIGRTGPRAGQPHRPLPALTLPSTHHYLGGALVGGACHRRQVPDQGRPGPLPVPSTIPEAGDFRAEIPVQNVSYQVAPHETRPN